MFKALGVIAASLAVFAVLAASAGAATYAVSGKQVVVNEEEGKYKMTGGLLGAWSITSFKELSSGPIFKAKGTERFNGCLDRGRDRKCGGDPKGTLTFRFLYWAKFGPGDSLIWGSCWHPVTGGTGDFAGADGVLTMVDTPTAHGVSTRYIGNITLAGGAAHARAWSAPARCG